MAKVFIVDDEDVYRSTLTYALSDAGFEVKTASSGREAIDLGARFRPDVLVTDWMLRDDIHGMHVAAVMRSMLPALGVVLITGFPSHDLREEAGRAEVGAFLQKPFGIQQLQQAVRSCLDAHGARAPQISVAVIEADARERIVFANPRARELMAQTRAGGDAPGLANLFGADRMPDLSAASDHWIVVRPLSDGDLEWHLRTQEPFDDGSRLILLRHRSEPMYMTMGMTEMLLGSTEPRQMYWPFEGRVLIVDDEQLLRQLQVATLERIGAGCYAVATHTEALQLLENDEGIEFAILDYDMPGCLAQDLVKEMVLRRPDVMIVGTSGMGRWEEFIAMGVEHYLPKPWRVEQLVTLLEGRLGDCVECGLPLPLRRPRAGDTPSSWQCSGCGARYRAVFDDDCPEASHVNARPAQDA